MSATAVKELQGSYEADPVHSVFGFSVPLPVFDRNQGAILEARRRLAKARAEQESAEVGVPGEAVAAHAARVLLSCGDMSTYRTSAMTSTSSPPRIGSGHDHTGRSTQSDLSPVAWFVDEPSKPQMGRSAPSAMILVFERNFAVGFVPSIQMYSAR